MKKLFLLLMTAVSGVTVFGQEVEPVQPGELAEVVDQIPESALVSTTVDGDITRKVYVFEGRQYVKEIKATQVATELLNASPDGKAAREIAELKHLTDKQLHAVLVVLQDPFLETRFFDAYTKGASPEQRKARLAKYRRELWIALGKKDGEKLTPNELEGLKKVHKLVERFNPKFDELIAD
jgi:hypothetical protein